MSNYNMLSPREIDRIALKINPGEWAVEVERPISTLLGSCVAVCLYDDALPIAGMNHFLLPKLTPNRYIDTVPNDKHLAGDVCLAALLDELLQRGAARHRLKAKAFGGGMVIQAQAARAKPIGEMNVEFTKEWLARERIPLLASDFLGTFSRKVLLVPQNGDVYCKRMPSNMLDAMSLHKQEQYAASILA